MADTATHASEPRSGRLVDDHVGLAQLLAAGWGVSFLVIGIVGLVATGFGDLTDRTGHVVLAVRVNGLQNLVHVGLGIAGLLCCRHPAAAHRYGKAQFKTCLLLFVIGMYAESHPEDNFIAGNGYAMGLHLLMALGARW